MDFESAIINRVAIFELFYRIFIIIIIITQKTYT